MKALFGALSQAVLPAPSVTVTPFLPTLTRNSPVVAVDVFFTLSEPGLIGSSFSSGGSPKAG